MTSAFRIAGLIAVTLSLSACSHLAGEGPAAKDVLASAGQPGPGDSRIQIVEMTDSVSLRLAKQRQQRLFSESMAGAAPVAAAVIGAGDAIEVNIWEAPPATLFASGVSTDLRGGTSGSRAFTLPEQVVDRDGTVNVPFAGKVPVQGKTPAEIETEVARRLKGKANQPEVLVRRVRNASATATVVGEVTQSIRLPLTPGGERLLDALAAAGGVRQPVNKMTVQITRGNSFQSMPLQTVIRDPRQNVLLQPGDVVTAIFQSSSYTAMGSFMKNEEVNFEAQGITLAQALARTGGLDDTRSDPRGVFIFRFEPQAALDWPNQPVATTAEGMVPVIYNISLKNPSSFFVMQNFQVQDKDVLYVSNAPAAELQKFLNLVLSVAYPALTATQLIQQ